MKKMISIVTVAALAGLAQADIAEYSQDFEGLNAASPTALGDDGWLVGANVFDSGGGFLYNYFAFPAPNGGAGFSGIATGQGGPAQGAQQLSVYNDYNNADHGAGNLIEANVFREYTVGAADVGKTWTFSFDFKRGNIDGATTAQAFIKTLDPSAGFTLTNYLIFDTTSASTDWSSSSLSLVIDSSLQGQLFQIGFLSVATNFEGSGIFYDNLNLTAIPAPAGVALLGLGGLAASRRRRG
jgi:hypothetical protein